MNDYEPDGFAEAIQQQTDEAKSRRGTMMSWIACRVNPASKRKKREVDARWWVSWTACGGDPAAKRDDKSARAMEKIKDYDVNHFAVAVQQQKI